MLIILTNDLCNLIKHTNCLYISDEIKIFHAFKNLNDLVCCDVIIILYNVAAFTVSWKSIFIKLELFRYQVAISFWIFEDNICESCIRRTDFITGHGDLLILNSLFIRTAWTNRMHYLLSMYFNNQRLRVSSRLTAHHQELLLCMYSNWYMSCIYVDWLLAGLILPTASQQKGMTQANCCIHRVIPPDDEQ